MKYHEFLARVRDVGEYTDVREAEHVVGVVLKTLAARLTPGEAADLAAQLPQPIAATLTGQPDEREAFGVREFIRRVAAGTGASEKTAEWDASAVLSTVAEAVSGGELNDVLTQLPSGYAVLFGKPALSG